MDNYDGISIGRLFTEFYIEESGLVNSLSFNKLYDLALRKDLKFNSPNVTALLKDDANSKVFEIIEKTNLKMLSKNQDTRGFTSINSVFGDKITAKRVAQITGNFYLGVEGSAYKDDLTGSGGIALKGATDYENLLSVYSGATANSTAKIEANESMRYVPGYEFGFYFTTEMVLPTGDGEIRVGLTDVQANGLGIAYKNGEFGFLRVKDEVEHFIPQSQFNIDKIDGTGPSGFNVDVTKGNIWLVTAGYLGYAPIVLHVLNEKGELIAVNKLEYPNKNNGTHISSTFLSPCAIVNNGTTAENVEVNIGSFNVFVVDGDSASVNNRNFSFGTVRTLSGTGAYTRRPIIAFKNSGLFLGTLMPSAKVHKIQTILDYLSITFDGQNKSGLLEIIAVPNADVTNIPTYTQVSPDSVLSQTINGTYDFTNSKVLFSTTFTSTSSKIEPRIKEINLKLLPGYHAVFVITSTTTLDITCVFSNAWSELF